MKKLIFSAAGVIVLAALSAFTLSTTSWQITDQYHIRFTSSDASGIFRKFEGAIEFDASNPAASKFDVKIDAASINTGNGLQNKHAKSAEWFDVAKYPVISYVSTKIEKAGDAWQVTGILDMHGVKKEVTIPFTFQQKGTEATFSGRFTVNRNDFHIGKPGGDVGEVITVAVAVPVVKK